MAALTSPGNEAPITWVNGARPHSLSPLDRGLAYGDGLFETMRYQRGGIVLLPWHWRRLLTDAQRLKISLSSDVLQAQLDNIATDIQNIEPADADYFQTNEYAALKLIVTRGEGGKGYVPDIAATPNLIWVYRRCIEQTEFVQRGVRLSVSSVRLSRSALLGGIKHLNRLEYVMASQAGELPEATQWLLLDDMDTVIEALTHNLFWYSQGKLCTPDLSFCGVAGVMRQWIIEQAKTLGYTVRIEQFLLCDILAAEEIFICNSLRGIWPVTHIDQIHFNPGPITRQLQRAIDQLWQ
ncbi:MAG TPA: aminodeoxychorismate lyase [Cellvibrionaceae bacterium]